MHCGAVHALILQQKAGVLNFSGVTCRVIEGPKIAHHTHRVWAQLRFEIISAAELRISVYLCLYDAIIAHVHIDRACKPSWDGDILPHFLSAWCGWKGCTVISSFTLTYTTTVYLEVSTF